MYKKEGRGACSICHHGYNESNTTARYCTGRVSRGDSQVPEQMIHPSPSRALQQKFHK